MNALPHVMIADALWTRLHSDECTRPFVLLGGIAPDAYRLAPHLDHRRLHFRSRQREGGRLRDLVDNWLLPVVERQDTELIGYWTGWLSHVIGDTVWRRILRHEFPELWDAGTAGSPGEKRQAREQYHADCDHADREIAQARPDYVASIRWLLRSATPPTDPSPLEAGILSQWSQDVVTYAMPPPKPPLPHAVISHTLVTRAISESVEATWDFLCAEAPALTANLESPPRYFGLP